MSIWYPSKSCRPISFFLYGFQAWIECSSFRLHSGVNATRVHSRWTELNSSTRTPVWTRRTGLYCMLLSTQLTDQSSTSRPSFAAANQHEVTKHSRNSDARDQWTRRVTGSTSCRSSGVTSHRQPRQCRRPRTVKGAQSDPNYVYQESVIRPCTGISQNHHPCLLTLPFRTGRYLLFP